MKTSPFALVTLIMALGACQTSSPYRPVSENLPQLTVAFAAANWDGRSIPTDGVCRQFGGKGMTPPLTVSGIPAGTTAIVVEYSDRSFQPMNNGGHGVIAFDIASGATSVNLPSVPEDTRSPGEGAIVERHNGNTGAGYLGACSGGRGNIYEADVKAVSKGTDNRLLATGRIRLGSY